MRTAIPAQRQTPVPCAAALREALETVLQHQLQQQASSEGEAMEQDDLPQPVTSPEQEERATKTEDEVTRAPQGGGTYGCNRNTSRCSSMDRPVRATAREPMEGEQRVTAAFQAAGGHAPPGPEVTTMPHRDPTVFNPNANYNREAFPPPQWCIPQVHATHMTVVPAATGGRDHSLTQGVCQGPGCHNGS